MTEYQKITDGTTLAFEKTHENAKLPQKNHASDTGYDVFCVEDKVVPARGSAVVDVGLKFANIPEGYWIKVEGRSGLGFKHGILPHPGIIDNGYRGDAGVKLYNLTDVDYQVKAGDRIAQFVLYPTVHADVAFGEAQESDRGEKGFGASGK
jgi:dUTP pyrophosphatase